MIQRHKQEMSISQQDFFRLLPLALKNIDYSVTNEDQIKVKYKGGELEIIPGIQHTRKIAALELPVLHVVFEFMNITSTDIDQFLIDFNRTYQRGGG